MPILHSLFAIILPLTSSKTFNLLRPLRPDDKAVSWQPEPRPISLGNMIFL